MPILLCLALVGLVGAVVIGTALGVLKASEVDKTVERWANKPPMDDQQFLNACEIPNEPFRRRVAIKARAAIAYLAGVPRETILPEHSFATDLIELPYWDSLDWLGFIFEVEWQFRGVVVIPPDPIRDALREAGGWDELRVKHVARAVSAAAERRKQSPRHRGADGWFARRAAAYCSRKRKEKEQRTR